MASLLSSVSFASLLTYSPRGTSEVSERSRLFRDAIKAVKPDVLELCARKIHELGGLDPFLGREVTLVPAPRSAPTQEGALWPSRLICGWLVARGLGREILPCLHRTTPVPKSAFAAKGNRPSVSLHYETMAVDRKLENPARITLVDDIVTKGATLLAAASRLAEAFPEADVRAFAVLRTMGRLTDVEKVVDLCRGTITLAGNDVRREP